MSSTNEIGTAREDLVAAALTLADAIAAADAATIPDAIREFRDADDRLRSLTRHAPRHDRASSTRPAAQTGAIATITPHYAVEPVHVMITQNGPAPMVVLSNVNVHANLDADQARALAAALTAAADRIDAPRTLRRRADVDAALVDMEG